MKSILMGGEAIWSKNNNKKVGNSCCCLQCLKSSTAGNNKSRNDDDQATIHKTVKFDNVAMRETSRHDAETSSSFESYSKQKYNQFQQLKPQGAIRKNDKQDATTQKLPVVSNQIQNGIRNREDERVQCRQAMTTNR